MDKDFQTISTNNLSMKTNRIDLVKIVQQIKKLIYPEALQPASFTKLPILLFSHKLLNIVDIEYLSRILTFVQTRFIINNRADEIKTLYGELNSNKIYFEQYLKYKRIIITID